MWKFSVPLLRRISATQVPLSGGFAQVGRVGALGAFCTTTPPSSSSSSSSSSAGSFQEEVKDYAAEISDIEAEYQYRKERRQALVGVVISNKAAKSITVDVRRPKYVSKYEKTVYKKRMFMAHDPDERCKPGDVVRIVPCRPMSKRKRHTVIDVLKEGVSLEELEEGA